MRYLLALSCCGVSVSQVDGHNYLGIPYRIRLSGGLPALDLPLTFLGRLKVGM